MDAFEKHLADLRREFAEYPAVLARLEADAPRRRRLHRRWRRRAALRAVLRAALVVLGVAEIVRLARHCAAWGGA